MEGEQEKSRDQNEGSGQQQPIGQQQSQQPQGQRQGQQPLGEQGEFGNQEPNAGQSASGQTSQSGGTDTLAQSEQPDLGGGGTSLSGASDLGGGETGLGSQGQGGGFVGSQGEESGDYLQNDGNPQAGFAEQGRGAPDQPDQGDIERGTERSQNRESDIEGSSGNS